MLDWTSRAIGGDPWYIDVVAYPGHVGILCEPGCVEGMAGCCFEKRSVTGIPPKSIDAPTHMIYAICRDYQNKVSIGVLFRIEPLNALTPV